MLLARASTLSLVVFLAGCFDPDYGERGASCNLVPRACPDGYVCLPVNDETNTCALESTASPPSIEALEVEPLQVSQATPGLHLTLRASRFKIEAPAMNQPNERFFGHYHLYVDVSPKSPQGVGYIAVFSAETTIGPDNKFMKYFTPGNHTLTARLAQHSHVELVPAVESAPVTVEVK